MTEEKTKNPSSEPIFEPKKDEFQRFSKDPRLSSENKSFNDNFPNSPFSLKLENETDSIKDKEAFYNAIREFKKREYQKLLPLEEKPLQNRRKILNTVTQIAESIILVTYKYTQKNLEAEIGIPSYLSSYKQNLISHLGIIGMGKLGASEMNYESDLDLIFVYSHEGETLGKKNLTNREFFIKFAQRLIQALNTMTSSGLCYNIDVELRPSGNAGTLVISFEHFVEHQMNKAQEWESMALLRARAVVAPEDFRNQINSQIQKLAFERPLPKHFFSVMHAIRQRVLLERAKESQTVIDLKLGSGGLMDIEFILQGIQLKNQHVFPNLRKSSLFDLIVSLKGYGFLEKAELDLIEQAHLYYRTIVSQLHLIKKCSLKQLDMNSDLFTEVRERLGLASDHELKDKLLILKTGVQKVYKRFYETP